MGRLSNCCCEPPNCLVSLLQARKSRCGFTALYTKTAGTYGTISRNRYLNYEISYYREKIGSGHLDGDPEGPIVSDTQIWTYESSAAITERRTGKMTTTETHNYFQEFYGGTPIPMDGPMTDPQIVVLLGDINSYFNTHKNDAAGEYVTSGTIGGTEWVLTINLDFEMEATEGKDILAFIFTRHRASTNDVGYENLDDIVEITVRVSVEYTDTMLEEDVEDLLTNYDTGSANGILGVPDNAIVTVTWNEAYVAIGSYVDATIAYDVDAWAAYETWPDPAVSVVTHGDPGAFFASYTQWWQHSAGSHSNGENFPADPGFSIYNCEFDHDGSLPIFLAGASDLADGGAVVREAIRFNVATAVCGEFALRHPNNTSAGTTCVAATTLGGRKVIYSPATVFVTNSQVTRPYSRTFTAPGYLTSSACPCSSAP